MRVAATDLDTCICLLVFCKELSQRSLYLDGEADHVDAVLEGPILSLADSLEQLDVVDGSAEAIHMYIFRHSLPHMSYYYQMFYFIEDLQQPSKHRLQ
jgi:hypothetical protein